MLALVVGALDDAMLVQLANALVAEGVATGQGEGLLFIVVVGLEADATFKNRLYH